MKVKGMGDKRKGSRGIAGFRILWSILLLSAGLLAVRLPDCCGQESAAGEGTDFQTSFPGEIQQEYVNPETGYRVVVEDSAQLLTEEQRLQLARAMEEITVYGNAALVTISRNEASTESFARGHYGELFGTESGTIFVIDMDQRNIWIHSDGQNYQAVTTAYANTITDNVYRYASKGDYYGCAMEAFREIRALLEGQKIAQPMKYISNALLAMILALLANYGLVIWFTRMRKPGTGDLLSCIYRKFEYRKLRAVHTHQSRIYDPVSGGSSGGHSGGSSGGGGSGGSSGGGGGHSF